MSERISDWLIAISVRLYRVLLHAYPVGFRQDYSTPMIQVFRDSCRSAAYHHGPLGIVPVWWRSLVDLVLNAGAEHLLEEKHMTHTFIRRWGALLGMVGIPLCTMLSIVLSPATIRAMKPLIVIGLIEGALLCLILVGIARHQQRAGSRFTVGDLGVVLTLVSLILTTLSYLIIALDFPRGLFNAITMELPFIHQSVQGLLRLLFLCGMIVWGIAKMRIRRSVVSYGSLLVLMGLTGMAQVLHPIVLDATGQIPPLQPMSVVLTTVQAAGWTLLAFILWSWRSEQHERPRAA